MDGYSWLVLKEVFGISSESQLQPSAILNGLPAFAARCSAFSRTLPPIGNASGMETNAAASVFGRVTKQTLAARLDLPSTRVVDEMVLFPARKVAPHSRETDRDGGNA